MKRVYLIKELSYLLKILNVDTDRRTLKKVLLSDPFYPCLASISKTLSFYGVENEAYLADEKHLKGLKNVIIHTTEENGHFYILKEYSTDYVSLYDGVDKTISSSEFFSMWDGIILKTGKVHQNYHQSTHHDITFFYGILFLLLISFFLLLKGRMNLALILLDTMGCVFAINDAKLVASYRRQLEVIQNINTNQYPLIWVNDFIFPKEYDIQDLPYIQDEILHLNKTT